jgi:ATP-dependent Clp protease protease subunit
LARVITLSDNITEKAIKDIIQDIQVCNFNDDESEEDSKKFVRKPIHLMINSCGGDLDCGTGLATMIKSSKTPIYTYCIGEALSSGFIIFICGHKRYCYEGSTFLYHQLSYSHGSTKLNAVNNNMAANKKFQERLDKIVIDHTKIKIEKLNEVNEKNLDWWIMPDEALKLGIVDEIL